MKACLCEGINRSSRIGETYDIGPACFEITSSEAGFPFVKGRGLNPFFALAEIAWFYLGSNKLSPLQHFIKEYDKYSDDGETLYGAYGYRVNYKFGFNQIDNVINELKCNPESRRAVINLYSPEDLKRLDSKDIPCNISILFKIRNNRLDITILNRSNDVFKGIPYNFFLFRFFQYIVAKKLNKEMGVHRHITDSLHLYLSDVEKAERALKNNNSRGADNIFLELNIFDDLIKSSNKINLLDWKNIPSERLKRFFLSYNAYKGVKGHPFFLRVDDDAKLLAYAEDWSNAHHS